MVVMTSLTGIALKAKLFRGLADPSRLAILETLHECPLSVSEIVIATGLTQSNVSNHLGCLRDCGLVVRTQFGRSVTYTISDDRVVTLLAVGDGLLSDIARSIFECTRYASGEGASHDAKA